MSLLVLVSPLCIIQSEFVPFIFLFVRHTLFISVIIAHPLVFVMFHPVIVTIYSQSFILYLTSTYHPHHLLYVMIVLIYLSPNKQQSLNSNRSTRFLSPSFYRHRVLNFVIQAIFFCPFSFFSQGISSPTLDSSHLTLVSICVL